MICLLAKLLSDAERSSALDRLIKMLIYSLFSPVSNKAECDKLCLASTLAGHLASTSIRKIIKKCYLHANLFSDTKQSSTLGRLTKNLKHTESQTSRSNRTYRLLNLIAGAVE